MYKGFYNFASFILYVCNAIELGLKGFSMIKGLNVVGVKGYNRFYCNRFL